MAYVDITKEYTEAAHVCDACMNNIVYARLPPDEVVTDIDKKDKTVKGEVAFTYACKVGLDNKPKVIKCNQFERLKNR